MVEMVNVLAVKIMLIIMKNNTINHPNKQTNKQQQQQNKGEKNSQNPEQ